MVQVIEQPKQERATCSKCGAVLGYTATEVKSTTYKDISGSTDTDYYISCPCCHDDVRVRKPGGICEYRY